MKRVILVHGWNHSPENLWFPWLIHSLESEGYEVFAPYFNQPPTRKWADMLLEKFGNLKSDTALMAYSAGAPVALRYMEKAEGMMAGALFVASIAYNVKNENYGYDFSTLFENGFDWEKIRRKAKKFVCIYSDNDKHVDKKHSDIYRKKLSAEIIIEHGGGHFTKYKEFPRALQEIKNFNYGE